MLSSNNGKLVETKKRKKNMMENYKIWKNKTSKIFVFEL